MTGFKDGASDDNPLGAPTDEDENEDEADDELSSAQTSPSTSADDGHDRSPQPARSAPKLPWIYERSSITDGRQTRQIHLQQSTLDRERGARGDAEALLGESVKKADLREAALLVGLDHVDEVAEQLREWGYDFGTA